ncbi:site-2 protease family protein [Ruegeria faecimaris]|uniref:Peptidase family M50 n=1 Tax=Ruegeria faecimaris TaxID=686389 RepID=A0A521BBG8_9RHOB|nr:site-2 protease family protein [Ruegeria faecimaris]SMO44090.1 Peptidase family M50 [Ruegeria faecimaris]
MNTENVLLELRGPWNVPIHFSQSLIFLVLIVVGINADPVNLPYALAFVAILLISILLHEFGHALGCLVQGVPVNRVVLYGGGGFCEHRRSTSAYEDELIVAMGPIVNLTLWAVCSLLEPFSNSPEIGWVLMVTAELNLWLALFNMLPLMPLDGGRLLFALLTRIMSANSAARVSGFIGLVGVLLWIPMMIFAYISFGFVFLFFPPILRHWQMLRYARY